MSTRSGTPPTGPRQRGAPTARVGRGITKRRAGPLRIDHDGDVEMGSSNGIAGRGRGANRRAPYNRGNTTSHAGRDTLQSRAPQGVFGAAQQRAIIQNIASGNANIRGTKARGLFQKSPARGGARTQKQENNLDEIKILGLKDSKAASNADGGLESLRGFLERKSAARIIKSHTEGDALIVSVKPSDAPSFLRLDDFTFAGAQLSIKSLHTNTESSNENISKESLKDVIRSILNRRYNTDLKLLDFSNLAEDEEVKKHSLFDFKTSAQSGESKLFKVLMQLFEEAFETREKKQDALISVNLSHNGLSTLATVTSLAQEFPNLKNIDLSNNELRSFGALGHWRRRFRSLDLMILSDNPIEQAIPNYHEEIISWYPTLRFLNGIQVRSDETVAALLQSRANAAQGALPFPVGTPSFTDIDGIAERFLLDFFALYDKDRAALAAKYYDPHSMFSLSVNNSSHSDKAGKMAPGTWDAYIRKSRSLSKLDNTRAIIAREHDGVSQVSKCWSSLPTTHHPSMTTENAKWLVESHTISGLPAPSMPPGTSVSGLLLTIHGEFDELDHAKAKRSFDRSFVLGPGAAPGSVRVISDMLILRAYGGSEAWLVDPAVTQANLERAQKEHMVMEFSQKSRLNLKYALLCLEESEWNWDTAVANFESAKATLPADATL